MNNYKVYMHRNKINNKVYIGITKVPYNIRWRLNGAGYNQQPKFYNAILKYGWDNFEHIIIAEGLTSDQASLMEQDLIKQYDSITNGYNTAKGGLTNYHCSDNKRKRLRTAMLGKKHTQATKNKISLSKKDTWRAVTCLETNNTYPSLALAAKETGVDKSSIGKCCRGEMYKAGGLTWRYADKQLADQYQQATKNRRNNAKKAVRCLNTGRVYETVKDAAIDTNSDASNIIKVCKGKYKTTNGLRWEYIKEGNNEN